MPTASARRKYYIDISYHEKLEKIRTEISGHPIWHLNSAIPLATAGLENPTTIKQNYRIHKDFAVVLEAIGKIEKNATSNSSY